MACKKKSQLFALIIILAGLTVTQSGSCSNECYNEKFDSGCKSDANSDAPHTLHMSVHPHLDAYWIFNMSSYYDPKPNQGDVHGYFRSNRFNSVKEIFNTITEVLRESKNHRQTYGKGSQKAHRSFFNSEMGFFKMWYRSLNETTKSTVKDLLKTKYWEIMGGGFVEHDEGCAYYEDIIENFQTGLSFLKEEFDYFPRAAVSADSFGHSQSTLAILAHLGVEGFFVERSDEHILLQNKTQFLWKAKSANGQYYGALPTHIRWAIHGFEDQFIGSNVNENLCQSKENYVNNLRRENEFLKQIVKSPHIMRYFGHDFQQFSDYSYRVIEAMMEKFSSEKCNRVTAVYGNPTEYFLTLMGEVFNKAKPLATREEDIMPIWDYDSGLYWTGYYTTDPYHKKDYRDAGRFLYAVRKFITPYYLISHKEPSKAQTVSGQYQTLEELAEQVAYLQHHDGISGTSKYRVMDELELQNQRFVDQITSSTLDEVFRLEFDEIAPSETLYCHFGQNCEIPSTEEQKPYGEIVLKVFNSAGFDRDEPIIVHMPFGVYYAADCPFETNCLCQEVPCECSLYLYPKVFGTYHSISLKLGSKPESVNVLQPLQSGHEEFSYNKTHLKFLLKGKEYFLGYKRIEAQSTSRSYKHLSRYGQQVQRSFSIRSGKYALGNNPNKVSDLASVSAVFHLQSSKSDILLIEWSRAGMRTYVRVDKGKTNELRVSTLSAAEGYYLADFYLEVTTAIQNEQRFFTDSNGWLVMPRKLFHHEDYEAHFESNKCDDVDGNSYPMTSFCYIEDNSDKVSINTDRPQGVIAYRPGTLWVNFDRLSADDGKWVYETTYRGEYQRFDHVITVQNTDNNERKIQALFDMPILLQMGLLNQQRPSEHPNLQNEESGESLSKSWKQYSGIEGLKTSMKPINDSSLLLRVHNLQDTQTKSFVLFANGTSPLLTAFFGSPVNFERVVERSMGNNMDYEEFLLKKWNWNSVVNLSNENSLFNKQFREEIVLRPLEIRTFSFSGVSFPEECFSPEQLSRSETVISYEFDTSKAMPRREDPIWEREVNEYLLQGDHCTQKSPIVIDKHFSEEHSTTFDESKPLSKPTEDFQTALKIDEVIPNKEENKNLDLSEINKKIAGFEILSRKQKQKYFEAKLKELQSWRANHPKG